MRLLDYLPEKYERSRSTAAIQNAVQPEADALWAARDWLLEQLDPHTASGKGLKLWEDAMGARPAAGDGLETRRGRVIAKIRGMGVVDGLLLQSIVESFGVNGVTVTEHPRENRVGVQYSAVSLSAAPDPSEVKAAILEVLPAHLDLELVVRFIQTIKIAGTFGVFSVTELPPAE